jgi:ADP-ribose pyrophosphatase YjhB (NUDIX family)
MAASNAPPSKIIGTKQAHVSYVDRFAVRVVTFNAANEVAIICAERDNYYKLPGGGIDPDEDHEVAAQREMREETGSLIKLRDNSYIATTEEYRNDLHQISYCYCADLVDGSGKPNLTEDEVLDKLSNSWMPADEAKKVMAAAEPTSELGRYIKERDIFLLDVAAQERGK